MYVLCTAQVPCRLIANLLIRLQGGSNLYFTYQSRIQGGGALFAESKDFNQSHCSVN